MNIPVTWAVDYAEYLLLAVAPCLFHYSNYLLPFVSVKPGSGQAGVR